MSKKKRSFAKTAATFRGGILVSRESHALVASLEAAPSQDRCQSETMTNQVHDLHPGGRRGVPSKNLPLTRRALCHSAVSPGSGRWSNKKLTHREKSYHRSLETHTGRQLQLKASVRHVVFLVIHYEYLGEFPVRSHSCFPRVRTVRYTLVESCGKGAVQTLPDATSSDGT